MEKEQTYTVRFEDVEVSAFDREDALESAVAYIREVYHSGQAESVVKEIRTGNKELIIKHEMDEVARKMTLNEAFLEALTLSEGVDSQEAAILSMLKDYPESINTFSDDYKKKVLEGWEYKILAD